jgi:hypothetical protein
MSNARSVALSYLSSLPNKAFAEFFYEAVRDRNTSDKADWRGHFILADTECVENDGVWDIDFIALDDGSYGQWHDGSSICQSGTCNSCGRAVRSWAKRAKCPVCGNAVYCT